MLRFCVKKRIQGKPGDVSSPFWVYDRKEMGWVCGFKRRKEAQKCADDSNDDNAHQVWRALEHMARLQRQERAIVRRARFRLIRA